ncbi:MULTISPECIES: hypothetical protein [Rahnella]|uniref:Uncharacterized protein n=1 Tax=Rahnella laticis TaxID=2787622 RepID=A0ABS0E7U1_9GAMM|nr:MULTISPECIES: hypothetical protein [Rahnella]MBF7981160.1 hypothetical protein [Rahnella laticis]MBF8001078.1 hypothetical protein [Rahnella sp. LAC-M12]
MNIYHDVLSEPHLNILRLCIIIRELQYNKLMRKQLTINKLCFFNAIIVSDSLTNSVLRYYGDTVVGIDDDDYDEGYSYHNKEHLREAFDGKYIRDMILKLSSLEKVSVENINHDLYLNLKKDMVFYDGYDLTDKWLKNINLIRFCLKKSDRELFNLLIGLIYE